MLIIGAKGHAKEIVEILIDKNEFDEFLFYDGKKSNKEKTLYNFPILKSVEEIKEVFKFNNKFCLGLGGSENRKELELQFTKLGGDLNSVISPLAKIHKYSVMESGVNIMAFAFISNDVRISRGVLVNSYASVHHDSFVGAFTEIAPGARILGECKIGSKCMIGANAVILPKIQIGDNISIGAGSVVTKDLIDPGVYVGIPAKKILK